MGSVNRSSCAPFDFDLVAIDPKTGYAGIKAGRSSRIR